MQTMGINVQTYLLTGNITDDASRISALPIEAQISIPGNRLASVKKHLKNYAADDENRIC
ncbi:hypothetical protein LNP26_26030 [Klebsiella variicola subsp. variicola]|nr:hypothetical protein [Klebsiella variicola subsp. variicola]